MRYKDVTQQIIGAAFEVHRNLGGGFLEKVYENALMLEFANTGLEARQQVPIPVYYKNERVGEYFADILVNGVIICELKAVDSISREHEIQLVHYLSATTIETGLLINFGKSVQVKRKILRYEKPVDTEKSC
jgi:GxxExxY protein